MKKKKLSGQEVEDLKRKWLDHVPQGLIDEIVEEINIPDSFEKAVAPAIVWYLVNCEPSQAIVISADEVTVANDETTLSFEMP